MRPSEEETKEALQLLGEAHQRLLDTHNYGIDLLVYRAIQLLGGLPETPPQEYQKAN